MISEKHRRMSVLSLALFKKKHVNSVLRKALEKSRTFNEKYSPPLVYAFIS